MQTLFQFITRARLTLVDFWKWHNSQIFIPHTALMRHLFSQIRISYLYIAPGSIIHTDYWKIYGQIDPTYQWITQNSESFTTFCWARRRRYTQNIERLWRNIRRIIPRYVRKRSHFVHCLAEFMFKKVFNINTYKRLNAFFNVMVKDSHVSVEIRTNRLL